MLKRYDVIIAGGSLAGAALALSLSRRGLRVRVVETERTFRDRVRGESFHPWGTAEAERLGLSDVLRAARVREARSWDTYVGGALVERRELAATSPTGHAGLNVHHPELQDALLAAAAQAGAEVSRGVRVAAVQPEVEIVGADVPERARAELVVLASGRRCGLRAALGLRLHGETSSLCVSGVLLQAALEEDATRAYCAPELGSMSVLVPLTAGRSRVYLAQRTAAAQRYSGAGDLPAFLGRCAALGVPRELTTAARALGPLATFTTRLSALDPASLPRGVVAVGDAAGCVDPALNSGMSLALRDVRCLCDHVDARTDLQRAAAAFARERSAYHAALLRIESWLRRILYRTGPDSLDVLHAARQRLSERRIDLIGLGPDAPVDSHTEAALFAPA